MPKDKICVLTKENFFRPDENIHIQMSNEFPDYIGVWHKHEYIEVVYVISGKATHEIGGKSYDVKRGDLFIVNMNTPHVFRVDVKSREPFVAYDLMFTPEFFDSSISGYHSLEVLNNSFMFHSLFASKVSPFFNVSGSEYMAFGELFNKIYMEHRGKKKGYIEIIRAYLIELIITIFRLDETSVNKSANVRNKQIVNFIVNFINENYKSPLSVSGLSRMVYLSPDYLGRIFRTYRGCTISAMIQKVRIEHACNKLVSTDESIADVSVSCGFEDKKFFYKVFKKHMGVLPGEYRRQIQNND